MTNPIFGLMFKLKSQPIIFKWKTLGRYPIHSLFCKTFIAKWYNGEVLIEERIIKPFS